MTVLVSSDLCLPDAQGVLDERQYAAAPSELSHVCPHCGGELVTLSEQIVRRLTVPATPTEIASLMGLTKHRMRREFFRLKAKGLIKRMDRTVPRNTGKRGLPYEYLWVKA